MANFQTHIKVASLASLVAGLAVYAANLTSKPQTIFIILLGVLGGILPDVDSPHSTSASWIFNILGGITSTLIIFGLLTQLGILLSLFLGASCFIFINKPLRKLLSKICVHRGVVHSIPMAFLLGSLSVLLIHSLTNDLLLSSISGCFLIFGFLIHLMLDELYSVNLDNIELKRSFGTAFCFFQRNNIVGYIVLYALLMVSLYCMPKITQHYFIHSSVIIGKSFLHHLLPSIKWQG